MSARLITFYSFKGGVGRTQALANVAVALARNGQRVIVADMDMESPGLHAFFGPEPGRSWSTQDLAQHPGLLDFLDEAAKLPKEEPLVVPHLLPCRHVQLEGVKGSIRLLLPGRLDDGYPSRIAGFSWDEFYRRNEGYAIMEVLRKQLVEADADYVLVDSRTGMTDVAGICTFQLPDIVVALFALHRQGIEGIRQVARAIEHARARSDDQRQRTLLLLPARVEESASPTRDYWVSEAQRRLQDVGGELLGDLYHRLPYDPRMAFGEQIVVGLEQSYLSDAYERLTGRLLALTGRRGDAAKTLQELQGPQITQEAVQRITRHAASLAEIVGRIQGELGAIQDALQPRLDEIGRALPEELLQPPESLHAYLQFLKRVSNLTDAAWHGWRDDWLARFREALVEAAKDDDDEQIDGGLAQLEELLVHGDLEQAKAHCDELAAKIPFHSRFGLLQRDELSAERLERSLPDRESRIRWLQGKLTDAVDVMLGDGARPRLAVIRNCLRLLIGEQEAGPSLWAAYDILCEPSDSPFSVDDNFAEIGQPLWQAAWTSYFDADVPDAPDDALPTGKHMRAQIQTLARRSELPAPLIEAVQQGLAKACAAWPNLAFEALFRLRSNDPVLRAALACVRRSASAKNARGILGLWLVHGGFDQRIFEQYVRVLLDANYVAEAFFACEAMTRRREDVSDSTWCPAVLGLAVLAARKQNHSVLQALLMHPEHRQRLTRTQAGLLFLVIIAGELAPWLVPDHGIVQQIRMYVLHESKQVRDEVLEAWLRWLEQNPAWDAAAAEECMELERQLREVMDGFPAHKSWSPGRVYKQEFRAYWDEAHDAVSRRKRGAAELKTFEGWLDRAYRVVVAGGFSRNPEPNGDAKHAMQRAFGDAQGLIARLLRIGAEQPMSPVQLREAHEQRSKARDAMLKELKALDDDLLAQDLAALLNDHG